METQRQVEGGPARRLVLSTWYPSADGGDGRGMTISDYFEIVLREGQLPETEGLPRPAAFEDHSEAEKRATIESHALDLQRALEHIRFQSWADAARIVILAWSYGGQTAARVQEREPLVRGTVSLDANVVPARPEESLELKRPLLLVVGADTTGRGVVHLNDLPPPWLGLRMPGLAHGNFNAEGYLPSMFAADTVYPWSLAREIGRTGYQAIVASRLPRRRD